MTESTAQDQAARDVLAPAPSVIDLYKVFFMIGALSFGGGLSGWMFQVIVVRRRWITEQSFLSGTALGQVLPGVNVANLSVYIGQQLRGVSGAVACLLGLLTAPFLAVLLFNAIYSQITGISWIHAALDGATAAALGLIGIVVVRSGQRALKAPFSALAMFATFFAVGIMQWPLVTSVLAIAPLSVTAAAWRARSNSNA